MGVACSPDLANLYMGEYEQHMLSVDKILLYQRYIDDIFTIIIADSEEDAERHFRHSMPAPPGLEFTVEVSEHRMVFLDLEIFRNKKDSHFQFRAYRKPLNHFERIPFSSAHPYWMKRGAFVGELSRLATLSSCIAYYQSAVDDLKRIYLGRDYPLSVINSWVKKHATTRWETKFEEKNVTTLDAPWILETELNDVWESVNMREVYDNVQVGWHGYGDFGPHSGNIWHTYGDNIPESLDRPEIILSRKRGTNMGDFLNGLNRRIKNTPHEHETVETNN
jgi:hypothetical protein